MHGDADGYEIFERECGTHAELDRITTKLKKLMDTDWNTQCGFDYNVYYEAFECEDWPGEMSSDRQRPTMLDGFKVFYYNDNGLKFNCEEYVDERK